MINLRVIGILNSVYKGEFYMLTTFISLGVLGATTIGGAILEKHLVKNDHVAAAKLLSDGMYHGMRIGGVCFIGYVFIKILIMF